MAERPGNQEHPLPSPPRHLDHQSFTPSGPQDQHQNQHHQFQRSPPPQQRHVEQQHPLPAQPGSTQHQNQYLPAPTRPSRTHQRTSTSGSNSKVRTFSLQSSRSHDSSGSKGKERAQDLRETHEEKEARRLRSKADPSFAISEAEPSVVAAMSGSSLAPLRAIQHKDALGNTIADPDKSNPTRNRWERPLDTIRSFEAAIEGGYSRKSLYRSETDSPMLWNRRSSYQPGMRTPEPRFQRDSYYNQRPISYQPHYGGGHDSAGPSRARNSYYDHQQSYPAPNAMSQGASRNRLSRMQTEPPQQPYAREQNVYPMPHNDRSYETVTSAAVSGSSDPAGYQTDPTSSDSGSVERPLPAKPQDPSDHGLGFTQAPNLRLAGPQASAQNGSTLLRKQVAVPQASETPAAQADKRKSWISRRFSKNK